MSKFNWQMASVDDLVQYMLNKDNDNIVRQQVNYYKRVDNKVMLDRIGTAKLHVKRILLKAQLFKVEKELGIFEGPY